MNIEFIESKFSDRGRSLCYRYIIDRIYPKIITKKVNFIDGKSEELFNNVNDGDEVGGNK